MYRLVVELKDFSAAHRLIKGYQGKCNHLHGHNYNLRLTILAQTLSSDDLVVDFAIIRECCDQWVQTYIDHSTLVYEEDKSLLEFLTRQQQKHYVFRRNTTVECLAHEIYQQLARVIAKQSESERHPFVLHEVELWESERCGVIYSVQSVQSQGVRCGESAISSG